jgi:hypothetical protein
VLITLLFLLDDSMTASSWGSSLKLLISLLIMVIAAIVAFIWWAKRG